ncbi:hypothetical protein [Eubacterium sp.]
MKISVIDIFEGLAKPDPLLLSNWIMVQNLQEKTLNNTLKIVSEKVD